MKNVKKIKAFPLRGRGTAVAVDEVLLAGADTSSVKNQRFLPASPQGEAFAQATLGQAAIGRPNMTKITAADYMVSGCSISIQFLNLRTLKKPITNKTALINSIAVITIKWTFPVTHCAQL